MRTKDKDCTLVGPWVSRCSWREAYKYAVAVGRGNLACGPFGQCSLCSVGVWVRIRLGRGGEKDPRASQSQGLAAFFAGEALLFQRSCREIPLNKESLCERLELIGVVV